MHKEINGSHMHKVSKSYHNEDSYHLTQIDQERTSSLKSFNKYSIEITKYSSQNHQESSINSPITNKAVSPLDTLDLRCSSPISSTISDDSLYSSAEYETPTAPIPGVSKSPDISGNFIIPTYIISKPASSYVSSDSPLNTGSAMPYLHSKTTTDWSKDQFWCSSRNSQISPLSTSNKILSPLIPCPKQSLMASSSSDSSSISDYSFYSSTELNTSRISIIEDNYPLTLAKAKSEKSLRSPTITTTPVSNRENTKVNTPDNLPCSSPLFSKTPTPRNIEDNNNTDSEGTDHIFQTPESNLEKKFK